MTDQPAIPGLEPPRENDSPMVRACHQTIAALDAAGKVAAHHAVLTQLMLSLCEAIDGGRRAGRASAVAMAARELRDTMLMIDPPPEDGAAGIDAARLLQDFMAKVEYAANHGGVLPDDMPPADAPH